MALSSLQRRLIMAAGGVMALAALFYILATALPSWYVERLSELSFFCKPGL